MRFLISPFMFFSRRKRLTKFFILAMAVFVIYGTLTITRREGIWVEFKLPLEPGTANTSTNLYIFSDSKPTGKQENGTAIHGVNGHIWHDFCPSSLQVLCYHPLFPKAPDQKSVITTLDITRHQDNYAQRIFGFLHPPKTGKYKFAISSDDFSELWLSPGEDPSKAVLICSLSEWTTRGDFKHSPSQVSREIELQEDRKYFIEILHVQMGGDDFFQVVWSVPGMTQGKFETIPTDRMSLFFNDIGTLHNYDMAPDSPACKSRPHHRHSLRTDATAMPLYLPHDMVTEALPYCDYKPSYLVKKEPPDGRPKQAYDFLNQHFFPIGSYPAVEYKTVINKFPAYGNHQLDPNTAQKVAKIYMNSLQQHYPG